VKADQVLTVKTKCAGKQGPDGYSYTVTPSDLQREQQAFQAGEGVIDT